MAKPSSFYVKNNPKLINLALEYTGIKNVCAIIKKFHFKMSTGYF